MKAVDRVLMTVVISAALIVIAEKAHAYALVDIFYWVRRGWPF